MQIHHFCLAVVLVLSGCASVRAESGATKTNEAGDATSICEIARHGLLLEGETARVVATYKTDKSHYSYLSDAECGRDGILNVGNLEPVSEESLQNFYEATDQRCSKAGTPYICVTTAIIDAEIKVIRDQEGKIAAELLKIHAFSFGDQSPM